jgi:hypothetical protein
MKILKYAEDLFPTPPSLFIFCYKSWQKEYENLQGTLPNIHFLPSLPTEAQLREMVTGHDHSMLIADDMLNEIRHSSFCTELFVRMSHHLKLTTLLILQDATIGNKFGSTLNKNSHYSILMRSPRDQYSVRSLGQQLGDYRTLITAYRDATKEPFSYLLVSSHPKSPDELRYRTSIFPSDPACICYIASNQ